MTLNNLTGSQYYGFLKKKLIIFGRRSLNRDCVLKIVFEVMGDTLNRIISNGEILSKSKKRRLQEALKGVSSWAYPSVGFGGKAALSYRDVLLTIHTSYDAIPVNCNVILQLHRDLYRFLPGRGGTWKPGDTHKAFAALPFT